MLIRRLGPSDAAALRQILLFAFEESPHAFSTDAEDYARQPDAALEELLASPEPDGERFALGAHDEHGALRGVLEFRRDRRRKALHKAKIDNLYVHPAARGHGVGGELVRAAIERARRMAGLEQIHLWVLHSRHGSAESFYRRLGFQSCGRVPHDLRVNDDWIDAEYMVLSLVAQSGDGVRAGGAPRGDESG